MKRIIFLLVFVFIMVGCVQEKKPLLGETDFQRDLNAYFKDATTSPLKDKDRKNFEGLDFFKFDPTFVVEARLVVTPDEIPFKMKTSTGRLPVYKKYGDLEFELKGETFKLNIYQNLELEEEEDYLFLPFLDNTNGDTSYGGGRYIETKIPEGDILVLDFNIAFNPYCAYNEKYSCPIVPRENYLPIEVNVGVKAFGKH